MYEDKQLSVQVKVKDISNFFREKIKDSTIVDKYDKIALKAIFASIKIH